MAKMIRDANRKPRQRNTLYENASSERIDAGLAAAEILEIINTPAKKYERKRKGKLLRPGLIQAVPVD
jgi:FO synthase